MKYTAITSDSSRAQPGSLFVAIQGGTRDGHEFIADAIRAGAIAVVGEKPKPASCTVSYEQVPDARLKLAQLAAEFYGHPSHKMLMVGVTGTSGKTTTTYLIESILQHAGHKVGVIGTVNTRYPGMIIESTHTTPGPVELQALLKQMKDAGCTAIVMEVSSHALKQKRTAYIAFDGAVFTNLSPEHLDFHPDMQDYFLTKKELFTVYAGYARDAKKNPAYAINLADSYGKKLLKDVPGSLAFGDEKLTIDWQGIRGEAHGVKIESPLLGQFNAENILAAVTITSALKIKSEAVQKGVAELKNIPGRLQAVQAGQAFQVLIDYAHKPDALEKVLQVLRPLLQKKGRLITVFGCGGDRDRKKRPIMGKIAATLSDQVIVTSDNPRTEDPDAIIREILEGTTQFKNVQVRPDRRQAIYEAVGLAHQGDIVLVAGKGHEDYQILGSKKIHFDDREEAERAIQAIVIIDKK